jgi:hypothetical protein
MALLSLSDVQNDYGSYSGNSLVGLLGARVTVPNDGLAGIIGKPYPFLNGILVKISGTIYTDSGYLNKIKTLGNPYISKRSLPMVSLSLSELTREEADIKVHDGNGGGPTYRATYAEANVTRRLQSVDDILRYLNDFFNPSTTDIVIDPKVLGGWSLSTTTYSAELDVKGIYPGLEFETLEDIATATTIKLSTPPTETAEKKPEPVVTVEVEDEPEELSVVLPKLDIVIPPLDDFLLNESIEFTKDTLSKPEGLAMTGLKDKYDTGAFGPMQAILDQLGGQGTYDNMNNGFGSFNNNRF